VIVVRITCEESRALSGEPLCPHADLDIDPSGLVVFQIANKLKPLGWSFNGPTQHFCPRHNPALKGLSLELTGDYIEPLPGVRLRLSAQAVSAGGARVRAELLLDLKRYDVEGGPTGPWRAKPIGTDWPTP
jgi:hypothetical protein